MSKNRNRAKLYKAKDGFEYNRLLLKMLYPPYYDEGWNRRIIKFPNHKYRSYKTWKYNRKTKWK